MRQLSSWDRGGGHLGTWMQASVEFENSGVGSLVTLQDGVTQLAAEYLTDIKSIQKYVQSDGNPASGREKVVCIFVFDGRAHGQINSGDILTFDGNKYVVNSPMYPQFAANQCVSLAVACDKP